MRSSSRRCSIQTVISSRSLERRMPTYQFRCPECSEMFEEKRGFAQSSEPAACPACGGDRAVKVIGTAMFFSKGDAARALLEPKPRKRAALAAPHGAGCPCCGGHAKSAL